MQTAGVREGTKVGNNFLSSSVFFSFLLNSDRCVLMADLVASEQNIPN